MCVPHTLGKLVLIEAVRFELNCSYSLNVIQEKNPYQLIPSFFLLPPCVFTVRSLVESRVNMAWVMGTPMPSLHIALVKKDEIKSLWPPKFEKLSVVQ